MPHGTAEHQPAEFRLVQPALGVHLDRALANERSPTAGDVLLSSAPIPLIVTNPDGGTATKSNAFVVNARPVVKVVGGSVTIASTTLTDANTLTLSVSVGGLASIGPRDLVVTNPDTGTTTCAGCFTVNAKPTIASLSPDAVPRGSAGQTVVLSGTGFQPGAGVTVGGPGVTVTIVSVTPTAITLEVTVTAGATTGSPAVTHQP